MDDLVNIYDVLSKLDRLDKNVYFLDFMNNDTFEVGILKLNPFQKDIQGPHSKDELYFVIEGEGYIRIYDKDHSVKKGSCVFVPSNTKHYFHGNNEELIVLYIFISNKGIG